MSDPGLTRKEAIWLACKQKSCCYAQVIIPTGRDIWRITRALQTPPWSFLVYFQSAEPRRDAFILDHSERHFRVALAKGASARTKTPPPCIFLMRTRNGYHRCGLGDLRPGVCRAFPSESVDGVLGVREDTGCACRTWSLADVDIGEEAALVDARQADSEEYCAIVARWNSKVALGPPEVAFDFFRYCEYLLAAYDELATTSDGITA